MKLYSIAPDLEVRLLEPHDAGDVYTVIEANREHIRPWLSWAEQNRTEAEVREFIESAQSGFAERKMLAGGIWKADRFAGGIGCNLDMVNHTASAGYWIAREHEGKGVVTRATDGLVRHLFATYPLKRVEIRCQKENARSRAVPKRLGFREEGILRQALRIGERSVDVVVYAMLREEWRG